MFLLIINSLLISAYIVLRFSKPHFYKLYRYEGQLLYIKALVIGAFCLGTTYLLDSFFSLVSLFSRYIPDNPISKKVDNLEYEVIFFTIPIVLAMLYCFLSFLWRLGYVYFQTENNNSELTYRERTKILALYKVLFDSPLERMLFESFVNKIPLIITMNDRKVYVGIVKILSEPTENKGATHEFSLFPILSGYRDTENLNVVLTNNYELGKTKHNLAIILKQDNIVTASEFILEVYQKVAKPKKQKKICT